MNKTLRKSMLECLKKKDSQNLAKLLEDEGFEIVIDPSEALKNHTERTRQVCEGKSRILVERGWKGVLIFEDLNDYTKVYGDSFIKQRNKNGTSEIVGYGVVENYIEPARVIIGVWFDPVDLFNKTLPIFPDKIMTKKNVFSLFEIEKKLKNPRHFFWYDVLEPKLTEQETDPFAPLKEFKATESKYHDLIQSD